MALLWT
ncbi:hypothetical protein CP10743SC13_2219A, partial [Chlamydia psittaci 10_743_SC13]